jgi:glycosyltransferase involved in cell wall biosynthesis
VLVDTAVFRRPPTGTARWVRGLVTALGDQRGIELVSSSGPARIEWFGWRSRHTRARDHLLNRVANLARQRWWYEFGIRRLADQEAADVLLLPANLAARRGRLPQVVAILDVNFLTKPETYEPASARYLAWSYKRAVRDADRLVTISEFSRSEICGHLGVASDAITVVYPGVDVPAAARPSPSPLGRPYALWVGATEVSKNVGLLLDAWVPGAPSGLTLAIVGPPGRDHATLVARAVGLADRVVITGAVTDAELEQWYQSAAVFLFPSRTEGFGFPPLEAMARGVPVIAASAGALPEVLGEAALFHHPDDREMLRSHILALMDDETRRGEQILRGFDRVARYRWDIAGHAMATLLRSAASRREGPDPC